MAGDTGPILGQPGTPQMPGPVMDMADSPNFRSIGKDVALGHDDAGIAAKNAKIFADTAYDWVGKVLQLFFQGLGVLGVWILKGLYGAMSELDPAFGAIAATVIGNMFDVPVDATAFASMTSPGARKKVGEDVGAALLRAMQGDAVGLGAGELEPGVAAAEKFLGVMANLAIEGWAMDLVGEAETLGYITNLGELNDRMASVMGLSRLSRTVLRPFVNTLIATPATWSVNKQYRPKMLTVPEAIAAVNRGDVDEGTMREIAARDGYGDDAIAALVNAAQKTLTPADGYFLTVAGQWQKQDAIDELRLGGRDAARAELEYNLEDLRALHTFELQMITAGVTAYAEHRIDEPTLMALLSAETIDARTIARLHELAAQRRKVNAPHLSEGQILAAVKRGVLNVTDYAAWLSARGYSDVDAVTLELVLQDELNELADKAAAREKAAATRAANAAAKLQALQAKRDQVAAEHIDWTGTLGQAERLVVRSVMPPTQYRQILVDHALSPGDADALVIVATQDRDRYLEAQGKRAAAAVKTTTPTLSLGALERATIMGALSLEQLRAELVTRKYDVADAGVIVDLVVDGIAARAAALARTAAAAAKLSSKGISLAQVQKAVVDGVQTLAQYSAFLTAEKFDATSTQTLVADMQVQLDNRALANARHAAAEQKLEASHLKLAQEEKAVVDGILTLTDYTLYLEAHGFDASDQAILTALLKTKLPA